MLFATSRPPAGAPLDVLRQKIEGMREPRSVVVFKVEGLDGAISKCHSRSRAMADFLSLQIKAARALLEWSQEDLAARAGLSIAIIRRFEACSKLRVSDEARLKMEAALEAAGIEFTNGHKPGVSLNKRGKE